MHDAGCIPDVCVFQWPGSVFGARCSVLGVGPNPVPGIRDQAPGTGTRQGNRAIRQEGSKAGGQSGTGYRVLGSVAGPRLADAGGWIPGTEYGTPSFKSG